MPIPEKYLADFEELGIYHIYNRTNNNDRLFYTDENRVFFLKQYKKYLSPFLDTYCWCLLPNHFHFLVRIKPIKSIQNSILIKDLNDRSLIEKRFIDGQSNISELIEHAFRRFFQSYSLAFNKAFNRKGNLFYKPFKRIEVKKESHFTQYIVYIHANPLKHGLIKNFDQYQWSSWSTYLSDAPTNLLRKEVIDWFGNKEQFVKAHVDLIQYYYNIDVSIEE